MAARVTTVEEAKCAVDSLASTFQVQYILFIYFIVKDNFTIHTTTIVVSIYKLSMKNVENKDVFHTHKQFQYSDMY